MATKFDIPRGVKVLHKEPGRHPRWGTAMDDISALTLSNGEIVYACTYCGKTWPGAGSAFAHLGKCDIRRERKPSKRAAAKQPVPTKKAAAIEKPVRAKQAATAKVVVVEEPATARAKPARATGPEPEVTLTQRIDAAWGDLEQSLAVLQQLLQRAVAEGKAQQERADAAEQQAAERQLALDELRQRLAALAA